MTTTEITRQHQFLKEILQTLQHNVLATFWCCSDWRLAFHFVSLRPGDLMSLLDSWDLNLKGHFNQWNISHLKFNLQNFAGFSGPSCLFGVLWQVIGVWGWEHWKHRTVRWVSIANFVMWDSHCCSDCEDPGDSFAVPRQDLVTRSQQHPGNLPWFCLRLVTLVQVFAVFATGWWLDQTNGMSFCNCHVFPEYYFIVVVDIRLTLKVLQWNLFPSWTWKIQAMMDGWNLCFWQFDSQQQCLIATFLGKASPVLFFREPWMRFKWCNVGVWRTHDSCARQIFSDEWWEPPAGFKLEYGAKIVHGFGIFVIQRFMIEVVRGHLGLTSHGATNNWPNF